MPGQVTVEFRGFTDERVALNLPRARRTTIPKQKTPGSIEESLIRTGVEGLALGSTRIRSLLDLLSPPPFSARIAGMVSRLPIRRSPNFTIAVGLVASAGAGVAAGMGAGIYFWNKSPRGQIGLFGSLSVGMMTNVGFGAGDSFAYMFDSAPAALAGDAITLEVSVEIGPLSVAGQMFLTAPPVTLWPPALTGPWVPEVIGVGFTLTAGISISPVHIAVMPARTWIHPLTP